ncbi:MAG TPA: hypothetical protein PKC28_02220 [Bdellovibrionales bacterium]|nr:hypothetical protein [Bdellovibrionales bacterium]
MLKLVLMFLALSSADVWGGTRIIGNPAGGVVREGVYKTFGSAGVYIDPSPLSTIPGMDVLVQAIDDMELTSWQAARLLEGILPFGARKYYNATEMDPLEQAKLIQEYARTTGQPARSIVIFAVTDVPSRVTYVFPEFYSLSPADQGAILFHESYWLLKSNASFAEVISAEIAFTRHVTAKAAGAYDPAFARKIGEILGDAAIPLNQALMTDIKSGALAEYLAPGLRLSLNHVFLGAGVGCSPRSPAGAHPSTMLHFALSDEQQLHLYRLIRGNPDSHFFRALLDFLSPDARGVKGRVDVGIPIAHADAAPDCGAAYARSRVSASRFTASGRSLFVE